MSKSAILDQAFPARTKAVLALCAAASPEDSTTFEGFVRDAKDIAAAFGRAPAAKRWEAFSVALEILRLLIEWEHASLTAAIDADRFLRAARLRLKQLRDKPAKESFAERVIEAFSLIDNDFEFSAIPALRIALAAIPMPVAVYADPLPEVPEWVKEREQSTPNETAPDLTVAFVEFKINGVPAESIHSLQPHQSHDLDIVARVSRWPDAASALVLSPLSLDPPSTYDLPTFRFNLQEGEPPFFFRQRGRMILHAAQNLKARPFEFHYTAEFEPLAAEKPVSIAGQRTLRLDGSGADRPPITGYPAVDTRLLSLRDKLRLNPSIPERDLDDMLTVLVPLANLMGQSAQDNKKFANVISEADFQHHVREWLRQNPSIGVELEEQPHAGGGRADLSYRGIRIELKCEPAKRLLPDDCKRYAAQPASYAVGTNRRLAILCVLDCSPKSEVAFPMEDGLFVYPLDTGTSPVYVVTVLIQGNLAKPSSLIT